MYVRTYIRTYVCTYVCMHVIEQLIYNCNMPRAISAAVYIGSISVKFQHQTELK